MKNIVYFFRLAKKQKGTTWLSVFSLSLGIAISLPIALGIWEEFNFDRFHKDKDQIYRVLTIGREYAYSSSFRQFGDAVKEVVPEVKEVCRIRYNGITLKSEKQLLTGRRTVETDGNFFTFFSFPLKYGDPETCLEDQNSLVISESLANRLLGSEEAVGKTITDGEGKVWKITAVMVDFPYASHIQTEIITPFTGRARLANCGGDIFTTYLKIPFLGDRQRLEEKITRLNYEQNSYMKEEGVTYRLEALGDIHFSKIFSDHQGSRSSVGILIIAAVIILLIACINFINLFISTSFLRAREIGIRKVAGASRGSLIGYFYLETLYYAMPALVIGVLLAWAALPLFNEVSGYRLHLDLISGRFYAVMGGLVALIVLGAGSFPAFHMTRYNVIDTVYRRFKGKALSLLREMLLVVQFTFSISFLLALFFVHDQIGYMIHFDVGLEKDRVICFYPKSAMLQHYRTVEEELLKSPAIGQVCMRDGLPVNWADGFPMQKPGTQERIQVELCEVEPNYFDFMGMEFVMGEAPFPVQGNTNYVVLNETAVKQLELKDPIHAVVSFWDEDWIVKGVVRDVLDKGLKTKTRAQVYYAVSGLMEESNYVIMCKVTGNTADAIEAVKEQWDIYHADYPFEYHFLDEAYASLYRNEQRLEKIFTYAMVVMMLISVTGLFAMAYYMMQCRVKEIGVRKVNGATTGSLLFLLNIDLLKWVVVAFFLACGLVWYFMDYWLNHFVYRIQLSAWSFLVAGIAAIAVALVTVSALTWKAARWNPVDSLKGE